MANTLRDNLLKEFQKKIGYQFNDVNLLDESLTHDSIRVTDPGKANYQRLEWLGDAVLQQIISEYLYFKHPNYKEGQLTNARKELVSAVKQKTIARKHDIEKYILLSPGVELKKFDRHDDFVESVIGAIYVDAGENGKQKATKFISMFWDIPMPGISKNESRCIIS